MALSIDGWGEVELAIINFKTTAINAVLGEAKLRTFGPTARTTFPRSRYFQEINTFLQRRRKIWKIGGILIYLILWNIKGVIGIYLYLTVKSLWAITLPVPSNLPPLLQTSRSRWRGFLIMWELKKESIDLKSAHDRTFGILKMSLNDKHKKEGEKG